MAHLPYADLNAPELQPLVQRIVAERGSVLHLYQMLMHSPPLAEGWLGLMTQVRQNLQLGGDLRELVIMRIAHLNGAPYEADQHAPIALREGLTPEQLAALPGWPAGADPINAAGADPISAAGADPFSPAGADPFTPLQRDVLRLCDTMTRDVHVAAPLVDAVRAQLGERQLVELVATIASYNMVSRFLEALQIHGDDARAAAKG